MIYEYIGSWGGGLGYVKQGEENSYESDEEWEYVGMWDLPETFLEKCLPVVYIE